MKTVHVVKDGFSCVAAAMKDGWVAGVTAISQPDQRFVAPVGDQTGPEAASDGLAELIGSFTGPRRSMLRLLCRNGQIESQELSQPDRIAGAAAAGGSKPALVWCQRQGKTWQMMLWTRAGASVLAEGQRQLAMPSCAWAGRELLAACEYDDAAGGKVGLWDGRGRFLFELPGRRPRLIAAGKGECFLLVECQEGRDCVALYAWRVRDGRPAEKIALPRVGDYNFNAQGLWCGRERKLYVVHESCPGWNMDHRVGQHRDICLWTLSAGQDRFQPAGGTCRGVLPLPRRAFWDLSPHNMPSVYPRLAMAAGRPAVAYRCIHFGGHRSFGWHVYVTHLNDQDWTEPARISQSLGLGDAAYEILPAGEQLAAFLPCCDVMPAVTLEEEAAGVTPSGRPARPRNTSNHRLEVVSFRAGDDLGGFEIPTNRKAPYLIPPSIRGVCPDPPEMEGVPEGLRLVWADMHPHTTYSKCLGPDDGFPQDVVRFQRDVLGCSVLCIVDHTSSMSWQEFAHVYDWLEMEAGDRCVVIYGAEPGCQPAHHINFYAIDRQAFDRLKVVSARLKHQQELFPFIRRHFPGMVLPMRHGHGHTSGDFGIRGPRVTELYDRDVEAAMEAMQLRGDMMLDLHWRVVDAPLFPSNYLSAGARIGLVAGTDHANPPGPNHFCLTGFWVRELTAEAVFEAIKQRKTVAASNAKVAIYAELDGKPIGEELTLSGPVRITARLAAGTGIQRACLMRDGQLLEWQDVSADRATIELVDESPSPGYHWYVVTVQARSMLTGKPAMAHASPFFVNVR